MKIVRLSAENVKRLSAVEIKPDGHIITIGGKNGAGKSSVLDSIAYALGGEKLIPQHPVRKGQDKAKVVVELEDLTVTRTFTAAGGGTLVVANKDGARYPSPQAILDKLVGRLSFDPLAFARMEPAHQRDTLRRLVGLDFTEIERNRLEVYNQRTEVNRQGKLLEHKVAALPSYALVPEDEVPLTEITTELERANAATAVVTALATDAETARENLSTKERFVADFDDVIAALESKLQRTKMDREQASRNAFDAKARIQEVEGRLDEARAAAPDLLAIRQRLEELEATNAKIRANKRRHEAAGEVTANKHQAEDLTTKIAAIDKQKADAIRAATFPIGGLALSEQGITFNDIPFEQASTAEQLRVSTAVGLALNPKLKVLLVRDGSALDSDGLALMADMAAKANAQVWIERVAESKDGVSVLIEDGAIRDA